MNLFSRGDNIEAREIAAENRQKNFAREQSITQAATNPQEELTYLQQQELKSDLLRWQQELGDEILDLVTTLQGVTTVDGKLVRVSEPICNIKFIYDVVVPQCKPFMSRNMINTNFNEIQILNDLKNTSNDIADAMGDNNDLYEIDFKNYDLVCRLIKNTIKAGAFRALNGWTKKIDSTVIKRIEATHEGLKDPQPKKKLLGIF